MFFSGGGAKTPEFSIDKWIINLPSNSIVGSNRENKMTINSIVRYGYILYYNEDHLKL